MALSIGFIYKENIREWKPVQIELGRHKPRVNCFNCDPVHFESEQLSVEFQPLLWMFCTERKISKDFERKKNLLMETVIHDYHVLLPSNSVQVEKKITE